MAHIKNLRGKKRYLATVHVTLPDGQVVRREKLFPDAKRETKRLAEKWELEERDRILEQNGKDSQTTTESLVVQGWINEYLDDIQRKQMSEKTYYEKKMAFVRLAAHPGIEPELPVVEIDRYLAKEHFVRLFDSGRSGSAVNRDRKNLGAAWKWGLNHTRDWPSGENPFLAVAKFPEQKKVRYVPSEDDFWTVTDYLAELAESGNPIFVQDYVIHMAFLHLAARRSEIFRLTLKDLDFDAGMVRLWTRKRAGGKWEFDWIPMATELKAHLVRWLKIKMGLGMQSDHVFVCVENTPYCSEYHGQPFKHRQHFMKRACRRAGVKPFGFHAIRHFTASYLFQKGHPVSVIQQILRHKSPNTTTRYLRKLGFETEGVRTALEEIKREKAEIIPLKGRTSK